MENYGLIPQQLAGEDFVLGGVASLPKTVLRPDGQWDDFLPSVELQRTPAYETFGCVSFSFLNCIETLLKARGWGEINFSDRALAKMSGTTKNGNSMRDVAETARTRGLVLENVWPFGGETREEFYKEVPGNILSTAKDFLGANQIGYEVVWSYPDQMCEALRYSPLQAALYAWGGEIGGIKQPVLKDSNHCIEIYGYEYGKYWKVYDTSTYSHKKISWEYDTFNYRFNIEKIMPEKNPLKLPNNILVQEVEQTGQFGMYLNGDILVAEKGREGALSLTLLMRGLNPVDPKQRRPMTSKEWAMYPKKDLAGNLL